MRGYLYFGQYHLGLTGSSVGKCSRLSQLSFGLSIDSYIYLLTYLLLGYLL